MVVVHELMAIRCCEERQRRSNPGRRDGFALLAMTGIHNLNAATTGFSTVGFPKTRRIRVELAKTFLGAAVAGSDLPPLPAGDEIYDLRPVVGVPYPWLSVIGEWALAIFLTWICFRLMKWALTAAKRAPRPSKPVDHLQEALKALERLRASPVWDAKRVKDVCERTALILKVFLKDQFRLGLGGAATSDELDDDLRRNRVPVSLTNRATDLLTVCDEVKYARGNLGDQSLDSLYSQVRDLLLRVDWRI